MNMDKISDALMKGNSNMVINLIQEALDEGISAQKIYKEGLVSGMEEVGKKMQSGEFFIPEVMLAGKVMNQALDIIRPSLIKMESDGSSLGRVVMGSVKGDLHDIGKNLVIAMLEGAGFEVTDLGMDVSSDKFVQAVKEKNADILGMSALLSVTMIEMGDVIESLKNAGIRENVKVIIGGACVTQSYAEEIGADAYCRDGGSAVETSKNLINAGVN